ncbi:MAG: hypothetical protein ACD_78C00181G0001 [uncultured bacterium (gcode 4)]|uniref:Uncharacterized protein n=1 Tax=uncultured bacterium (gcode 4) TaxID=1234023 RepID=K1XYG2_9BACT|nr:MAG: hypothetical protein ACD_78C00181G0001 [uncultured bacterium (gcode 4)]
MEHNFIIFILSYWGLSPERDKYDKPEPSNNYCPPKIDEKMTCGNQELGEWREFALISEYLNNLRNDHRHEDHNGADHNHDNRCRIHECSFEFLRDTGNLFYLIGKLYERSIEFPGFFSGLDDRALGIREVIPVFTKRLTEIFPWSYPRNYITVGFFE